MTRSLKSSEIDKLSNNKNIERLEEILIQLKIILLYLEEATNLKFTEKDL